MSQSRSPFWGPLRAQGKGPLRAPREGPHEGPEGGPLRAQREGPLRAQGGSPLRAQGGPKGPGGKGPLQAGQQIRKWYMYVYMCIHMWYIWNSRQVGLLWWTIIIPKAITQSRIGRFSYHRIVMADGAPQLHEQVSALKGQVEKLASEVADLQRNVCIYVFMYVVIHAYIDVRILLFILFQMLFIAFH